jgi:hypothetical protein
MFNNNIKKQNKNKILSLILIIFCSVFTFAQFEEGWKAANTTDVIIANNPGSPNNSSDPVGTPIDDNILALLVLGLGLGVFKIHTKKDKIIHKVE